MPPVDRWVPHTEQLRDLGDTQFPGPVHSTDEGSGVAGGISDAVHGHLVALCDRGRRQALPAIGDPSVDQLRCR